MKFDRTYTLAEIAQMIGATYTGPANHAVTGINEIHMVEPGDLTFVDHPKYYDKALNSKATTIVINKEVECPAGKSLLLSDDPFAAYVSLARKFRPFVTSTAAISATAEIGEGTVIQPNVFIGHHVKIGRNCIIHANVSIYDHVIIGDDVIVHSNSVLGADAYYFQRKPDGFRKMESCGTVVIGNRVEIGAPRHLYRAQLPDRFSCRHCRRHTHRRRRNPVGTRGHKQRHCNWQRRHHTGYFGRR
jgi:UDP-3-O-[3-hydroxymyristoyl] glucosamine N-acyltransferase